MTSATTPQGAVRFRATVQLGGKSATGVRVPDDVVAALREGRG